MSVLRTCLLICCAAFPATGFAETHDATHARQMARIDQERDRNTDSLRDKYEVGLQQLLDQAKNKGQLEHAVALHEELNRFKTSGELPGALAQNAVLSRFQKGTQHALS